MTRQFATAAHECDRLGLLFAIENSLRAGDIPAKIPGETVVKEG